MQQFSLIAEYKSEYTNSKKNLVFVYRLRGSKDALERYAELKGDHLATCDDTDRPLYFTTRYLGDEGQVTISQNGDIHDVSDVRKVEAILKQHEGTALGDALRAEAAKQMLSGFNLGKRNQAPSRPSQQNLPPDPEQDQEEGPVDQDV